jgi:hypothetical protein
VGNVLSAAQLATIPIVDSTFTASDANGDQLHNTGTAAYLSVPAPGSPTDVTAVQTGDQLEVTWTLAPVIPAVITSSTLTATPVDSTAPILMATVAGSAVTELIGPLQPQTTYQITVVSTTIGGSSLPSDPITVMTVPASVVPSAPTGVTAIWIAPEETTATLVASWNAADPGNSPVDKYQIRIKDFDSGVVLRQTVPGTILTGALTVSSVPDWTVTVRAHNAAGWSTWSAPFTLGGL